ncbi:MAG TPA: hypothetical protein VF618_22975 [Thermoanaerobaculia bacterium]
MTDPKPKFITSAADVRFSKFTPKDRDSPILEVLHREEVLFREELLLQIARVDGADRNSELEVIFFPAIDRVRITAAALTAIVTKGVGLVTAHEDASESGRNDPGRRESSADSLEVSDPTRWAGASHSPCSTRASFIWRTQKNSFWIAGRSTCRLTPISTFCPP